MQHGAGAPPFPRHFDGKRFFNPNGSSARGFLDVLRWKLTSRPEPSARFIPDVEPSKPPVLRGRKPAASYADQPFHATAPARRLPHIDRSDLVGAGESAGRDRSAPPQGAGRAMGGSSADRYRAAQPQSLRPSGSCHLAPAGGPGRVAVHRSGRSRPTASLPEHRPRPRTGLGRITATRPNHAFTGFRQCIFPREESSTAT